MTKQKLRDMFRRKLWPGFQQEPFPVHLYSEWIEQKLVDLMTKNEKAKEKEIKYVK